MKKLYFLLAAAAMLTLSARGQFMEKNKKLLGGSIGIHFSTVNDSTETGSNRTKARNFGFSLSPSFGKAIKNDLVFGYYATVGFNTARNENSQNARMSRSSNYQVGGGVFLEKFFALSNRLAFSGQLSGGAGYSSYRGREYTSALLTQTNKTKNFTAGISLVPLLNYKLSTKVLVGLYANDFMAITMVKGTTETSTPNTNAVKSIHTNFSASSFLNSGKSLQQVGFSFRFIL